MITPQTQVLVNRAEESHQAAKVLLDTGFSNYSAAQSYYTMFYTEALLHSKTCSFRVIQQSSRPLEKSLQKPEYLTPNFIDVLLLQRDAAKQVITEWKALLQKKKRLSLSNGRRNSYRLSKVIWAYDLE